MTKYEFLSELREGLSGLPEEDIQKSVDYYSEMIEDQIEDGIAQEEAVKAMGSAAKIANQILMDTPLPKLMKAKAKPNRTLKAGEIVLLILGAPLWLSLLLAGVLTIAAIYTAIWAMIASLYVAVLAVGIGAFAGVIGFGVLLIEHQFVQAAMYLGLGLMLGGTMIVLFLGCNLIAKGVAAGSRRILRGLKSCFIGKGNRE